MPRCRRDQLTRDQTRGDNLQGEHATSRWTVVSRTGWTRRKRKRSSWGLFEVEVEQVSAATCLGQVEEGGPCFYELFMLLYRAPSLPQCAGDLGPSGGTWGAASRLTAAALLSQDEMWSVLAGLSKSGWTGRDFAWFFWRRGIPARAWLVWAPLTPWRGKRGGPLYSLGTSSAGSGPC